MQMGRFDCPMYEIPYASSIFLHSLFSYSGVIRIGLTRMNGKKMENYWDKIYLAGWKWSRLNVPGTEV